MKQRINRALYKATGHTLIKGDAQAKGPAVVTASPGAKPQARKPGMVRSRASAERSLAALEGVPLEKLSLTDIANLNGTDKGTIGPSQRWPAHNYTDVYEAYLAPWRDKEITILEVGLGVPGEHWDARMAHGRNEGGGGSLKTWRDYFPKAHIHGADINAAPHLDGERTRTHIVDQSDHTALKGLVAEIGTEIDLILDDGSHNPQHQQITLGCLWPALRPGGIYIIEDLLANGLGDGRQNRMSSDKVLNTRRVLKHFQREGTFEEPHGLGDTTSLAAEIETLSFHVLGNNWHDNTEGVVVLRKKLP